MTSYFRKRESIIGNKRRENNWLYTYAKGLWEHVSLDRNNGVQLLM